MRGEPFAAFRRAQIPHSVGIGAMPGLRIQIVQARSEFLSHTTRINEHQCSAVRENLIQILRSTTGQMEPEVRSPAAPTNAEESNASLASESPPGSGRKHLYHPPAQCPAFSKSLHGRRDTTDMAERTVQHPRHRHAAWHSRTANHACFPTAQSCANPLQAAHRDSRW